MSGNAAERDSPRATPPHRPRHQITRSISELSSPIRLHRQHHDHVSHARREREREDRTATAATATATAFSQPLIPTLSTMDSMPGSKSEGVTPNMSPMPSRRASILGGDELGAAASRSITREEQVRQEQQKAAARVTGLKTTINDLNTFSSTTTRRLDDTYYGLLEKLGSLQSTILSLKELATMTQETSASFRRESDELVDEVGTQLDSLGQFEDQARRVEALKSRIHAGRERIGALSGRVGVVRERIEGWERADREWQERTRRRLKVAWVVSSAVVFLLVLLLVSAQYAPAASVEEAAVTVGAANDSLGYPRSHAESGKNGTANGVREAGDRSHLESMSGRIAGDPIPPSDERLRVFDEL